MICTDTIVTLFLWPWTINFLTQIGDTSWIICWYCKIKHIKCFYNLPFPTYISVFLCTWIRTYVHSCACRCTWCTINLGFPLIDYFCSLPSSELGEVARNRREGGGSNYGNERTTEGNQRKKAEAAKMMKAMRDKDMWLQFLATTWASETCQILGSGEPKAEGVCTMTPTDQQVLCASQMLYTFVYC